MRYALLLSVVLLSGCEYLTSAEPGDEMRLPPPSQESWVMDDTANVASIPPEVTIVEAEDIVTAPAPTSMQSPTTDNKISVLRDEVMRLQAEVNSLKPHIQKVDVIDAQLKQIASELDKIDGKYGLVETPKLKPQSAKPAKKPALKTAPKTSVPTQSMKVTSGSKEVGRVRFGKSGNATRVVLDLGASAKFSTDLDNEENLLVIELPDTKYSAKAQGTGSGIVQSYTGKTSEDGTAQIVLQLKQAVKVSASETLPPNGPYGHRVYLDLTPQ